MTADNTEVWHAIPLPKAKGDLIVETISNEYLIIRGFVLTPKGIVGVYGNSKWPMTMLDFVCNGLQYRTHMPHYYQPRYLVTLARRFATYIAQECEKQEPAP